VIRAIGADDILIVVSLIFGLAFSSVLVVGERKYYLGHHIWDVPPSTSPGGRLNTYLTEILYNIAAGAVRISVLLLYRRLTIKFSRSFLVATWLGVAFITVGTLATTIPIIFQCSPVNAYWKSWDPTWAATHKFHCMPDGILLITNPANGVFADLYAAVLPMMMLRYVRVPWRQKIMLTVLFALGFVVVGCSVMRLVSTTWIVNNKNRDYPWALWEHWIWTVVELDVSICCASAPALRIFFTSTKRARDGRVLIRSDDADTPAKRRCGAGQKVHMEETVGDMSDVNDNGLEFVTSVLSSGSGLQSSLSLDKGMQGPSHEQV